MINDSTESTDERESHPYEEFIKQKKLKVDDTDDKSVVKKEEKTPNRELRTVIKVMVDIGVCTTQELIIDFYGEIAGYYCWK